jgi:hypothetical protein
MGWGTFIAGQALRQVRRQGRITRSEQKNAEDSLRTLLWIVRSIGTGLLYAFPNKQIREYRMAQPPVLPTRFLPVLLLCILLGGLGAHRFKVGKHGTGWLMFLSGGGFLIWWLVDLLRIITFRFEDFWGRTIRPGI